MKRGFIFMLDAFISLIIVIAFVSSLSQFSRDYSYMQDESLYSYGRSMMDILLSREVNITVSATEPKAYHTVPLIHALGNSKGQEEMEMIDKLVPQQYDYIVEYYNSTDSSWKVLYDPHRGKREVQKAVSVVSVIPVIFQNERYTSPYTYGDFCGDPENPANRCVSPEDLYRPDEFGSYDKAFVRVVIKI